MIGLANKAKDREVTQHYCSFSLTGMLPTCSTRKHDTKTIFVASQTFNLCAFVKHPGAEAFVWCPLQPTVKPRKEFIHSPSSVRDFVRTWNFMWLYPVDFSASFLPPFCSLPLLPSSFLPLSQPSFHLSSLFLPIISNKSQQSSRCL